MGDFNAYIKSSSIFGSELIEFCNMNDLFLLTNLCFYLRLLLMLVGPNILRHGWIIVLQLEQVNPLLLKKYIVDNIVCSDHLPLCMEIKCDIMPVCNSTCAQESRDVCK